MESKDRKDNVRNLRGGTILLSEIINIGNACPFPVNTEQENIGLHENNYGLV